MEKRFQIFVSSTYEDLQAERQEVMHALLELDCIPSGMELFPAASEDQWTLIKQVIDDCDYYIVIIGGKYGSIHESGLSYTEREYRYALERDKPVIGFLHRDPQTMLAGRTEHDPAKIQKLEDFRALVKAKMCKFWTSPADLGSVVSRSLINLIKRHPAIGWVRADLMPDESATEEILRLRKQVEALQSRLADSATAPPPGSEKLAQGDDAFTIRFASTVDMDSSEDESPVVTLNLEYSASWNEIFASISPSLINEATERDLGARLGDAPTMRRFVEQQVRRLPNAGRHTRILNVRLAADSYHTITVQLRALGLIARSNKPRSVKDHQTYWTLTPYGDSVMTRLRAIPRREIETNGVTISERADVSSIDK